MAQPRVAVWRMVASLVVMVAMTACAGSVASPNATSAVSSSPAIATPTGSAVAGPSAPVSATPSSSPGTSPGTSPTHPAPGRIAVVVGPPDGSMIVLMTPGSGEPDDIVAAGGSPAWAPDGRRIAYACRQDPTELPGLCVVDLDRRQAPPTLVMPEVLTVTWSPVDDTLAIGRSPIDFGNSFVVRPDGTGLRELTMDQFETRVDLWSPDGSKVAGAASFGGASAPVITACVIASLACRTLGPGRAEGWSPDGARLLAIEGGAASVNLVALDQATGERTVLLDTEPSVAAAAWSSTGRIAAVGEDGSLLILDAPGQQPRRVAGDLRIAGRPAWSPDGEWLALRAEAGSIGEIFLVRADGTDLRQLTHGGVGGAVAWAPAP